MSDTVLFVLGLTVETYELVNEFSGGSNEGLLIWLDLSDFHGVKFLLSHDSYRLTIV